MSGLDISEAVGHVLPVVKYAHNYYEKHTWYTYTDVDVCVHV